MGRMIFAAQLEKNNPYYMKKISLVIAAISFAVCALAKNEVPAKMDDLWCIERIWAVVGSKVYGGGQKQPKSLPALKRRIIKAWKSLDPKILKTAVHRMQLRMKEIVNRKGNRIGSFKEHCECQSCVE